MSKGRKNELETAAYLCMVTWLADIIREIDDPDHSGPEDAATLVVGHVMADARRRVTEGDWHDVFEELGLKTFASEEVKAGK